MPTSESRPSPSSLQAAQDTRSTSTSITVTNAATSSQPSYLSALRQIDNIPVHDLASTLTNPADGELLSAAIASASGLSFPRTQIDPQDEWRAQNATRHRTIANSSMTEMTDTVGALAARLQEDQEALRSRRERLQRVLSRLNRMHGGSINAHTETYGEGVPNQNNLYDWSPGPASDDESLVESDDIEILAIEAELRRQNPNYRPEMLSAMLERRLERDMRERASITRSLNTSETNSDSHRRTETSLRSQAILQAVRRHPRFSARSRDYMQRYVLDRPDRNSGTSAQTTLETRERYSGSHERFPWYRRPLQETPAPDGDHHARRTRMDSRSADNDSLTNSIIYLGNLRHASSYEDSLGYAVDSRFVTKEFFGERHDDFVLDVYSLITVVPTSMLSRGSKFKGHQRANPEASQRSARRRWERDWAPWESSQDEAGAINHQRARANLPRLTLDDSLRPSSSDLSHDHSSVPPHAQRAPKYWAPDQWPVEVTIHEVDWQRMRLSATMEAQDVPSHSTSTNDAQRSRSRSPSYSRSDHMQSNENFDSLPEHPQPDERIHAEALRRATPLSHGPGSQIHVGSDQRTDLPPLKTITTYLEGEMLDFRTHSFLTEAYPSTPANDAKYWRKLEPFRGFHEDELHRRLLSREFLQDLNRQWILMRWKERCFVDASPLSPVSPSLGTNGEAALDSRSHGSSGESYEMAEGCGLTISGFYYVCMRRSDGAIEGLYCDPQSSPYQHLVLEREGGESWWWGWEFK